MSCRATAERMLNPSPSLQLRISGLRFMQPDQSGIPVSGSFDLFYPVNPAAEKPGPPRPSGASAKLEIVFEEAKVGMTVFTIYEAHNLVPEAGSAGRLKPYVTFQIGEGYHKKSATGSADGNSAFWGEDQVNMWIDRSNWVSNVALQCLSEDVGTDGVVGSAVRSLLPPMRVLPHKAQQSAVLLERDGEQVGELLMRQLFLPAGVLTIQCKGGRGLRGAKAAASAVISSAMSLINPYVVFKADSQATISTRQTKVARDANQDPVWSDTLTMDIVDQYSLQVDCFDHDLVAEDALIGSAKVSLLPVFKKGRFDGWVEISAMMSYGAPRPAGELHLVLEFKVRGCILTTFLCLWHC
jgi:Ca2+-dependent lipid-binding protein